MTPPAEVPAPRKSKTRPRDISSSVARNLRNAREELDPNRTRFAEEFGIHHTLWGKWERGKTAAGTGSKGNYPDPAVMVELCEKYGLTMDFIYRGILDYMPNERLKLRLAAKPEYQKQLAKTARPEGNEGLAASHSTNGHSPGASGMSGKVRDRVF